jgi:4-amino-4-deoxy-L-arabinose transferase-like glycosyltransferase
VQDEASYVLQSRIFATGRWTVPSPPIPEFFQQAHVLTEPAVASKFPPGHALLLSLGALFGAPALVPLLLTGITAALLFALARRVANEWVALLAWIIWLGDPINLRYRLSYFSELTSGAMWCVSWWALLEWRATRQRRWLLALAAAVGYGAITRPLTMLAFAVPVGVIVIRDVAREKRWADLGYGVLLGTAILGILPLWSARTTGNWRLSPQTLYTREYMPFDKPGFGVDSTPPTETLSPPNRFTYEGFFAEHVVHTPANLPRIALTRLGVIAHDQWSGPRIVLVPFVLIGAFAMTGEVLFALVCSLALFAGYLSYGHWAHWTLYYFEGMPVLSMLAAIGIWKAIGKVRALPAPRLGAAACALLALLAAYDLRAERAWHANATAWDRAFHEMVAKLPMPAAVIFVHYAPGIGPHPSIVANSPHLENEAVWIVNDLGPRDVELMRYTGQRVPIDFYAATGRTEVNQTLIAAALAR